MDFIRGIHLESPLSRRPGIILCLPARSFAVIKVPHYSSAALMSENQENVAPKEARKKIEEARRAGDYYLSLSRFVLVELPDSIDKLSQLQYLNLARNPLPPLPNTLHPLTHYLTLHLTPT